MREGSIAALLLAALACIPGIAQAADPCLDCHSQKTPGIVKAWQESAHFRKQVACTNCHGKDVEACHSGKAVVDAAQCGSCHKQPLADHRQSRHGIAARTGRTCTRTQPKTPDQQKSCAVCHDPSTGTALVKTQSPMFAAQTMEMQRQGCSACHQVETRCDSCHTRHGTDLASARDPRTCATCHMGPDHPQWEMWETSRHGVLYSQKGAVNAPSCVQCHMASGSHDVSKGIRSGPTTTGEREAMLAVCSRCHTRAFSARNLSDGDAIRLQSESLVAEAQQIVTGLEQDGLIAPSPADRPPHPLFGSNFVTGSQMLYENLSITEALLFKMRMFYAPTAWKGVYHQNQDYAHWYGNAPLKLTLSEIRSTADLLRKVDLLNKRLDAAPGAGRKEQAELEGIRGMLRSLNEQRLKREITELDYQQRKKKILDENGL